MEQEMFHPYQLREENYEEFKETLGTASFAADYLSWSVCWDKCKQLLPTVIHELVMYEYEGKPFSGIMQPDGSVMVHCRITYETPDGNTYPHNEYLAVRDKRNQSVQNPNAVQVENTYRRALAKGVSTLTGFGISLWMNEDLRSMMVKEETLLNGEKPAEGMITVDQNVKLDRLMLDPLTTPSDKKRIKALKEANWKGVTEEVATILISDVNAGRKGSRKATKKSKDTLIKMIEESTDISRANKTKSIGWINERAKTNNDLAEIQSKLKLVEAS